MEIFFLREKSNGNNQFKLIICCDVNDRLFRSVTGSVMFSTLEDGKIVKGLYGVPDEGPVLFVGYHMLMGLELISLIDQFLSQKGIALRGIAHPDLFTGKLDSYSSEFSMIDWVKVFGGVPVSASNLFKLLSTKSHVLLYPGGAREALHFKVHHLSLCYRIFYPRLFYVLTFSM